MSRPPRRTAALTPYLVVFVSSMGVMIVELVASRLVSKYFGTSLYTWTGVIGVVLGGISLGNVVGGSLADRHDPRRLATVLLVTASVLVFSVLFLDLLLERIMGRVGASVPTAERVLRAVVAIFLLFFPPSCALGAVSPAAAKLALLTSTRIGNTVGRVYALGSIGSILGTFLSGYLLIPLLGLRTIVLLVGVVLAGVALLAGPPRAPTLVWLVLMVAAYLAFFRPGVRAEGVLYSEYTPYSYVEVRDDAEERVLVMDGLVHNRYDPREPGRLLYDYERIFAALTQGFAQPGSPLRTLTLGGGAFLFPLHLQEEYPHGRHDVVEIDPDVVEVAHRYFGLPRQSGPGIAVEDARTYVQSLPESKRYDVVYLDAFNSFSVPPHLCTFEFLESIREVLSPSGMFVANVVDILDEGKLLGAFVRTASEVFASVAVYVTPDSTPRLRTTFVVDCSAGIAVPDELRFEGELVGKRLEAGVLEGILTRNRSRVLTDDHAPVEKLIAPVFAAGIR